MLSPVAHCPEALYYCPSAHNAFDLSFLQLIMWNELGEFDKDLVALL